MSNRFGMVNADALMRHVTERCQANGMTVGEFIAAGEAGTLHPDELRDLWLAASLAITQIHARSVSGGAPQ